MQLLFILHIGHTEDLERTLSLRLSDYMLAQVIRGLVDMVADKPFSVVCVHLACQRWHRCVPREVKSHPDVRAVGLTKRSLLLALVLGRGLSSKPSQSCMRFVCCKHTTLMALRTLQRYTALPNELLFTKLLHSAHAASNPGAKC